MRPRWAAVPLQAAALADLGSLLLRTCMHVCMLSCRAAKRRAQRMHHPSNLHCKPPLCRKDHTCMAGDLHRPGSRAAAPHPSACCIILRVRTAGSRAAVIAPGAPVQPAAQVAPRQAALRRLRPRVHLGQARAPEVQLRHRWPGRAAGAVCCACMCPSSVKQLLTRLVDSNSDMHAARLCTWSMRSHLQHAPAVALRRPLPWLQQRSAQGCRRG
jgi:hypothetical protein